MGTTIKVMWLSQEEILSLGISMATVIELTEAALAEHGRGRVENPPKPGIHPRPDTFIHAMPAYLQDSDIGGLKWVSGYPQNRARGLPQIIGLLVLNDVETGAPLCVMDATWITGVRTAAVSAVTARYCARPEATILGVVGAGVQGRYHLSALKEVLPGLRRVKVMDIDRAAAEAFRDELGPRYGVEVEVHERVEDVARGADVLLTATQRLQNPLIREEWFEAGTLGLGLEASRAWYGQAILRADKFITDDWNQTRSFHAQGAFPDGLPAQYTELSTIVTGQNPGRENERERILAINIGLALEDMRLAAYIYELAVKAGGYRMLEL